MEGNWQKCPDGVEANLNIQQFYSWNKLLSSQRIVLRKP